MARDDADDGVAGDAPFDLDEAHAVAAEVVREALVRLRGGAPFLSSTDAALLVGWLDDGVSVARILRGVETAAAKRRAQRVRAPLQLRHARRWIGAPPPRTAPLLAADGPAHPLGPLVGALAGTALDPALRPLADALLADLLALPADDRDRLADDATARIVAFFGDAWEALGDGGRARYVARAASRLIDVLDDLDETLREALLEEHARGILRDEVGCLSLTTILLLVDA